MSESADTADRIHVYGPVPSRRLGFSLGVDILPYKTCSLDCVYCQLGRTPNTTVDTQAYFDEEDILAQIQETVASHKTIDYITFSGSGEPTLHSGLGRLIRRIKAETDIPVAVLTNGTRLMRDDVQEALLAADLVVPSLDAVTQDVFEKVNRPHPSIKIDDVIQGLARFRRRFSGQIWIEVMLVAGINDAPEHIKTLGGILQKLSPDKVQLNTVVRPPAEEFAQALDRERLEKIQAELGPNTEIIADFSERPQLSQEKDIGSAILTYVKRRPATLTDLANSLGLHRNEVIKYLNLLLEDRRLNVVFHKGRKYYEPA